MNKFQTKSRNMFSDIGAGFKSMVGGEIKAMTKLTKDLRNELIFEAMEQVTLL
ncbi:MAG: heavy metal-binding domain-containing protein [Microcystis panniformis]